MAKASKINFSSGEDMDEDETGEIRRIRRWQE